MVFLANFFLPRDRSGEFGLSLEVTMRQRFISLLCCLGFMAVVVASAAAEPVDPAIPFATSNQSPLVAIFGLPSAGAATVLAPGKTAVELRADLASLCSSDEKADETVLLDGESYRFTLALRHGVAGRFEFGLEIPYVMHRKGFLDSFIVDWHDFFHLPQGERDDMPYDRLSYNYVKNGQTEVDLDNESDGLGDLRLTGAWQLWQREGEEPQAMALRASLKLPTGDADRLLGSGSTDLALWLSGSQTFHEGSLALFGAAGALFMSDSDVLADQQHHTVAFGTLGGGWRPLNRLALKAQVDGHTSCYRGSDLPELSDSLQLAVGGSVGLTETLTLDLAIAEDIAVATAPDIVFHMSLKQIF